MAKSPWRAISTTSGSHRGHLGIPAQRPYLHHRRNRVRRTWLLESLLWANESRSETPAVVLTRDPRPSRKGAAPGGPPAVTWFKAIAAFRFSRRRFTLGLPRRHRAEFTPMRAAAGSHLRSRSRRNSSGCWNSPAPTARAACCSPVPARYTAASPPTDAHAGRLSPARLTSDPLGLRPGKANLRIHVRHVCRAVWFAR